LQSAGYEKKKAGQPVGDEVIQEERKDYNREGQEETGFASSVVPTLEEKTISEQRPHKEQAEINEEYYAQAESESMSSQMQNGHAASNGAASSDLRTDDNVLFGAPANAKSPGIDDAPPSRSLNNDVDEEEQAAPGARTKIRENLSNKSGRRNYWSVPTVKPRVEPDDFEDPISDTFWKDIWVASAVHNVSDSLFLSLSLSLSLFLQCHVD